MVGLLTLAIVGVVASKLSQRLYPAAVQTALPSADCDVRRGACTAAFAAGGLVTFGIEPRTIPLVRPLVLQVRVEGLEPRGIRVAGVEVDFVGVDMAMGYNRVALAERDPDVYQGAGMLPLCARQRMLWEARVLLHTDAGLLAAPFRFTTER